MESRLKLSPRLLAAARMVRQGSSAADVGTDHGYLACYLALEWGCKKVYASDLNQGPLEQAARTVREYGAEGWVTVLLSDGVKELPLEEITDVVVAGMGGDLILSIVNDPRLRDPEKRLVLQPMTKAEVLRRGLYQMGFEVCEETAVRDGRFVYTVITARYAGLVKDIDDCFALTGLLAGRTEEETAYLSRLVSRLDQKLRGIAQSGNSGDAEHLLQLKKQIEEKMKLGND